MDRFEKWLLEDGLSEGTAKTYVRSVKSSLKRRSPLAILKSKDSPKNTKTLYRSALLKWAEYKGDDDLLKDLQSPSLARSIKSGSHRLKKKVRPFTEEQAQAFVQTLDTLHRAEDIEDWVWPVISLFRKLALRAGVDLCQIRRDAILEALQTGSLQLWTKGERVREVGVRHVQEELHELLELQDWHTIADLISPAANPLTRREAAYKRVTAYLKAIAEASGLDPREVHSHRFRHTRAVELYRVSKDIRAVQKFLGHRSIQTTQEYLQIDLSEIDDYFDE